MAYEGNQFSYYQNIQLDEDGALIVSVDGLTGGTSSGFGTHFGFELNKNLEYTLNLLGGPVNQYGVIENTVRVIPFIPQQTLTIDTLRLYAKSIATGMTTTEVTIVCYDSVNGLPNTLLFQSPIITASTIGFYTYNTSFTFEAGTTYWIGTYGNGGGTFFEVLEYTMGIGQSTLGATQNYKLYYGPSTFPNDVSTFPTPITPNEAAPINIRFRFD